MDKTMRAVVIPAINAEKSQRATDAVKLTAPITLKHTKIQSNLSIVAMSSMANTTNPGQWQRPIWKPGQPLLFCMFH